MSAPEGGAGGPTAAPRPMLTLPPRIARVFPTTSHYIHALYAVTLECKADAIESTSPVAAQKLRLLAEFCWFEIAR